MAQILKQGNNYQRKYKCLICGSKFIALDSELSLSGRVVPVRWGYESLKYIVCPRCGIESSIGLGVVQKSIWPKKVKNG